MKRLFTIGLVLLTMLALASVASADVPAPGGPFATAFRVQNLGASTASCTFAFYNSSGATAYSTPSAISVAPGDSLYVYTPDIGTLASGAYSGVVSCDQPVAAVVNFSDANSGASHNGVAADELATTWYAPGIYDNFFNYYSDIVVQNATSGPINITVEIYEAGNPVPVKTTTATGVPANASANFEQEGAAELGQDIAYSAKIIGTGNIAAIVNIYGRAGADNQLYSYNPFAAGSTTAYAPVIMNAFFGYNTSLTVQNIGASSTPVTVTYGTGQVQTFNLGANSANQLYTPISGVPSGSLTGVTVVSGGQPIVLLVNESNAYNRAASYSGASSGGTEVRTPIVMKRYFAYNSSVTCQNVGGLSTVMTIDYSSIGPNSASGSIAPGGTFLFYQPSEGSLPDGYIGSATITASQPIVCVANQDLNEPPLDTSNQDQLYAYNGIIP